MAAERNWWRSPSSSSCCRYKRFGKLGIVLLFEHLFQASSYRTLGVVHLCWVLCYGFLSWCCSILIFVGLSTCANPCRVAICVTRGLLCCARARVVKYVPHALIHVGQ